MKFKKESACTRPQAAMLCAVAIVLLMFAKGAFASGPVEKVIYSFLGQDDATMPMAGLVADGAGNLYGTSLAGGDSTCGCGSVFELSPPALPGGVWTESVIYSFQGDSTDGRSPYGTLIIDKLGNLYGTTSDFPTRSGTVFELSPPTAPGGAWTHNRLYRFPANGVAGSGPFGKLVIDGKGHLYGTTLVGGRQVGTVFELTPAATSGAPWSEVVLHNFGKPGDGSEPNKNLILHGGALYGTTPDGFVFQLVIESGRWTEKILYEFPFNSFGGPGDGLVFDSAGNLYGTLTAGGTSTNCQLGCGAIFELSPPAVPGDRWVNTTLYNFTNGPDGATPRATLIIDKAGNLYGTASNNPRALRPPATMGRPSN